MEWSEGDMSLINPVTPPGIDPRTVRLVAQRLDHYATPQDWGSFAILVQQYTCGNKAPRVAGTRALFNTKRTTALFCYEELGDNILLMPLGVI